MASIWQSTAFRIKDPGKSIPFYEKHFGMRCIQRDNDSGGSSWERFFLTRPRELTKYHRGDDDVLLELWHEVGAEDNPTIYYDSGNKEPKRGFGHIGFAVDDVYATSASLESAGVDFIKRPDEGRMKGLAFCRDPDGYWIELVKRSGHVSFPETFNLAQTMLRVKDARKSLAFYCEVLGAVLGAEHHFKDFRSYFNHRGFNLDTYLRVCVLSVEHSLYFLAWPIPGSPPCPDAPKDSPEVHAWIKSLWCPILELTHNHNTELVAGPAYHNGNTDPLGFRHLSFRLKKGGKKLSELQVELECKGGGLVIQDLGPDHSTFADPDGYWVRLYYKS